MVFELVQAMKFKISLPDENFLLLVQVCMHLFAQGPVILLRHHSPISNRLWTTIIIPELATRNSHLVNKHVVYNIACIDYHGATSQCVHAFRRHWVRGFISTYVPPVMRYTVGIKLTTLVEIGTDWWMDYLCWVLDSNFNNCLVTHISWWSSNQWRKMGYHCWYKYTWRTRNVIQDTCTYVDQHMCCRVYERTSKWMYRVYIWYPHTFQGQGKSNKWSYKAYLLNKNYYSNELWPYGLLSS
jgi:hypothetical protein